MEFFYGKNNPFSNFYHINLWILLPWPFGWRRIHSSDQLYQFHKAYYIKDIGRSWDILGAKSALDCKKIGKKVKITNHLLWNRDKVGIMRYCLMEKFIYSDKNNFLSQLLLNSTPILAECNPFDKFWGIGLKLKDARFMAPTDWPGENWMGKLLMELREYLTMRKEGNPQ